MKQFGDLSELNSVSLRKDSYEIDIVTSSGTYTATVTLTLPPVLAGSDTLVAAASTQSLTNKNLKSGTNLLTGAKADSLQTETGNFTITFPAGAARTLASLDGSETLTNKILGLSKIPSTTEVTDASDATKQLAFSLSGMTTAKTVTIASAATDDRTITLPNETGTLVTQEGTFTPTGNVTVTDSKFFVADFADPTKILAFAVENITTGTTRTVTIPDLSGTLALIDASQSITNKTFQQSNIYYTRDDRLYLYNAADGTKLVTFSAAAISTGTTRTLTIPNASGTMTLNDATQTLTNKDVVVDSTTFRDQSDSSKTFHFVASSLSAASNRLITIPNFNGTMATLAGSESFTNKNLKSATNLLTGAAADSFVTETGGHVITLPAGAAYTLASLTGTETFTNKTLTTPVINDYADVNEESAPATPAAGTVRVYAKTDKRLYQKDSDGVETALAPLASVSAIGTIDTGTPAANGAQVSGSNLILQSASVTVPGLVNNAPQEFSGVKTAKDGLTVSAKFVYDTTSTATSTTTTTLTATSKPHQIFTGTAIQTCDMPSTSGLSLGQVFIITNLSTGNVTVRTSTGNALAVLPQDYSVTLRVLSTGSNASASWARDNTTGRTLETVQPTGAVTVSWSAAFGTTSNSSAFAYRVADRQIGRATVKCGTAAGSAASMTLPSGIVIDDAKMFGTDGQHIVGRAQRIRTGGSPASSQIVDVFYDGADTSKLFFSFSSASDALSKSVGNDWFASSDYVYVEWDIPVVAYSY